jgi:WD40-like Beta Propeller Repeat
VKSRNGPLGFSQSARILLISVSLVRTLAAGSAPESATLLHRPPRLTPDYAGLVIPPNIAPLNFVVAEPDVLRHRVRLVGRAGQPVEITGKSASVEIPIRPWRQLLAANAGQVVFIDIRVQGRDGGWKQFERLTNTVSSDDIDGYLVYRLLRPVYNIYGPMGVYQRDLGNFQERPLLENKSLEQGCLNCHTFLDHRPDHMALHIRNKGAGNPMLLIQSNEVTRVDLTGGYLSWHPSGRLLTFSVNQFALLFHTAGETRDLYDGASDLRIYRVDSNSVMTVAAIAKPDRLETWPSWSSDGRFLYFCAAPKLKMERLKQIRYDLMRVAYDIDLDHWGELETVVSARETRLSAAQPRVSPDGQWLLFCMAPNGNFPAYQPGSDLYLMNLQSREMRRLDINSDVSDSWHCWSSNGRWVVFSSKRRDGLFTRPYFTHMTQDGQFSKPFLLPQRDPLFYDSFLRTYNLPELIQRPVTVTSQQLVQGVFKPRRELKPATLDLNAMSADHDADEGRSAGLKRDLPTQPRE